ncbi:lipid A export ATP-binding/permease protein MsbA [Deep-sea thermophilic phage D6E]|uniref:type IV secretory system conjugative DNA transfer family protein n=1 Tax=Deep-sea thermophilic phage D6E TaxID=749413 RepID=UPI0001F390F2|nr:type IV secretory system conjugative DNA transfer family protein [Deep-sea thermophilic phage D6E]ADE87509.1 lipid A export ATP-binding/permease protein MsbA [Deep-sea thermophilic phage D6E]
MGSDRVHRDAIRAGHHECFGRSREKHREMKTLRITPDIRLTNQNVEELARTMCVYMSPLERWNGKGFDDAPFLSFETVLEKENTGFYVTVPASQAALVRKAIESAWPKVAVEETEEPFTEAPHLASELSYERHYMFSLRVDRRTLGALPSVLETLRNMSEGEKVYIQVLATPAHRDWYVGAVEAYSRFKRGDMPQKWRLDKKTVGRTTLKILAHTVYGAASVMTELLTGEELEPLRLDGGERAMILRDGRLSEATLSKAKGDAYEVQIRVGVVCHNPAKAHTLLRMVTMAFRELDGDNMLVSAPTNPEKTFQRMKERKMSPSLQKDYFSVAELSRLHLLPTAEYQEKYHIPNIAQLETEVPSAFTNGGLYFGDVTYKKATIPVYHPTNNHDILCLPRVYIGGMGSGKTRGAAANMVVEAVHNGFGALAIDPAKGEIYEEVSSVLPSDEIIHIRLGKRPIALDWREVAHSPKARNRLANTILGFFDQADLEAGGQTSRFLRAAVMALRTGRLSEMLRIFQDEDYREQVISVMPDSIHKTTLKQYHESSESRQNQILSPILNRLDTILGDEYLAECMDADDGIDMVALMEQKKAIIIDVPKSELGAEAVNLIINLLCTKIDLAMTLRKAQHPFFVLLDEPHQFLRSVNIWKSAAVESRKWRVGYCWFFHSWDQLPADLIEIIKSAGPHYTIYASSKKTFRDLAEEIAPFTIEDGIRLKRFHAINVLRSEDGMQKPFIAKMAAPPSKRKKREGGD